MYVNTQLSVRAIDGKFIHKYVESKEDVKYVKIKCFTVHI